MKKKYQITLGEFEDCGIAGQLQELINGEYERMDFYDASFVVELDKKYEELNEKIEYWDGNEFQNYAYKLITDLYVGYSFPDGNEINFENTLIVDGYGNIFSEEDVKELENAEREYDDLYDSEIRKENITLIEHWVSENFDEIEKEFSGLEEYEIVNAIKGNMDTNGTAWEIVKEDDQRDIEEQIDTLHALMTANYRHNQTNYDNIDKSRMSEDQVSNLRKQFN